MNAVAFLQAGRRTETDMSSHFQAAVRGWRPSFRALWAIIFIVTSASPALAGPYHRSPEDPLGILVILTMPIWWLISWGSVAMARRAYRGLPQTRGDELRAWRDAAVVSAGAFMAGWGVAFIVVPPLTGIWGSAWWLSYLLCILAYISNIVVLRLWLTHRATKALANRPEAEIAAALASVRWWATWPIAGFAGVVVTLAFLGTWSMVRSMGR